MDHEFCPGSKLLRQPAPEFFTCPTCGEEVEIWTDEFKRNCLKCGKAVYRDAGMSCLDWCKHGKECVGDSVYDSYMKNKSVGIKSCLLDNIRKQLGTERSRVDHVERVLSNAEKLLQTERGDWHIVIPASILYELREKAEGNEGQRIARDILLRQGLRMTDIDEICTLIAPPASKRVASDNSRILHDAEALAGLHATVQGKTTEQVSGMIEEMFRTETGRKLARELYDQELCASA